MRTSFLACIALGLPRDQALISNYEKGKTLPRKASLVRLLAIIDGGRAMSRFQLRTVRGYGFGEVSSAMQKAIRPADVQLAGYWARAISSARVTIGTRM